MAQTDEELIIDYLRGNDKAMELIFLKFKVQVFNYAFRLLSNRADAEDVTADTFLAIFAKKYSYQPEVKFVTWLYTVVRNACIDRIRKRKKHVSLSVKNKEDNEAEGAQIDVVDEKAVPVENIEENERARQVQLAINKLPDEQKEAIILRAYHSMDYQQISQIMNCSLPNVKILIFRARENLRKELSFFMMEGAE